MAPVQVDALASALAKAEVLPDWKFYLMWAAVTLLSAAGGAYLGAYWRKRGEQAATKADFTELIQQLRETTKAAESVRTELAHDDWTQREWKTLRRTKGEELIEEAHKAKEAYRQIGAKYLFSDVPLDQELGLRVYTLALIYFPEALIPTLEFASLLQQGTNLLIDIRKEMANSGDSLQYSPVRGRRLDEALAHMDKLTKPLDEIRDIVKTCVWRAYGLPDYVHDTEAALQTLQKLIEGQHSTTPPPAQTPSAPSPGAPAG